MHTAKAWADLSFAECIGISGFIMYSLFFLQ